MTPSATEPDWSREAPRSFWDPSRKLLKSIRDYQAGGPVMRRWAALRHRVWSIVTGADIPLNARLGGGLILPHPNGVVIHPEAEVGPNCILFQQVTLGTNGDTGAPHLGGHVDIGPGARILGEVAIGDHAVIGANAVVLSDIPPHAVAAGVPARLIRERQTS